MTKMILILFMLVVGVGLYTVRADILVRSDGGLREAKVIRQDANEVIVQVDGATTQKVEHIDTKTLSRVILTDEHGAVLPDKSAAAQPAKTWRVTTEPAAPPVDRQSGKPTYYVVPLHGEIGAAVMASVLERSLKDALARKPAVVVLDIDSPGGAIEEAQEIVKILHEYNKQLRIVALTGKDLSAAAIITLSTKEIYVKSTSTIGAATAYRVTPSSMPAPLAEKFMSTWRAVARNSAEEGGHEPLLAEAMIDSDMALYMGFSDGKPIIRTERGDPNDKVLCRQGKILTLTSREAVDCGLAKALADDYEELGKALGLPGWTECKGLGTLLADYQVGQIKLFTEQATEIKHQFESDLKAAITADPSAGTYMNRIVQVSSPIGPMTPMTRHTFHGPMVPMTPRMGGPGTVSERVEAVVPPETRATWQAKSLACVVALQQAEQDIRDILSLCKTFGREVNDDYFSSLQNEIAAARARVYENRDRYSGSQPPLVAQSKPAATPVADAPPHDPRLRPDVPPGSVKTDLVGGAKGGGPFVRAKSPATPVIGFAYETGKWMNHPAIKQLEPLYQKPDGVTAVVLAKDGYVVGGVIVDAMDDVRAVRVIFVRLKDGKVAADDTYMSDWIGTPAGQQTTLAGKGETVVGICGRKGLFLESLGLVVVAPAGSPAAASAPAK